MGPIVTMCFMWNCECLRAGTRSSMSVPETGPFLCLANLFPMPLSSMHHFFYFYGFLSICSLIVWVLLWILSYTEWEYQDFSAVLTPLYGGMVLFLIQVDLILEAGDGFFWSSLNVRPWVPELQGWTLTVLVLVLSKERHSCPSLFGKWFIFLHFPLVGTKVWVGHKTVWFPVPP